MGSTQRQRAFVALSILLSAMTIGAASDALAQAGPDMSTHLAGLDPTVASVLEGVRASLGPLEGDAPYLRAASGVEVYAGAGDVRLSARATD